jgi:hypothetical protein
VSLIYNERAKLTANYLNAAASSFFAAGVVAPLAAAVSVSPDPVRLSRR